MNIRDFKKWIFVLNEYSGFLKMNICFEWTFWIFIKWIICWTNILVLVCPNYKWLSPNVSNSSEITQGSLVVPTYFSPFQGVYYLNRGLRRAPKPYFGLILEFWIICLNFFEWIIVLNILDSIEWIFFEWIFRILFWIESFLGLIQWKNEFSKRIGQGYSPHKA